MLILKEAMHQVALAGAYDFHLSRRIMSKFNVLFVGASWVNFGGAEGPWDHASRLQKKLEDRLNVVGIVDPDLGRAQMRLDAKRALKLPGWDQCQLYPSIAAAGARVPKETPPMLALLGIQPTFRGSDVPGKDSELQIHKFFPNCAIFGEKPISSANRPFDHLHNLLPTMEKKFCSTGYMLRYLKAVQYIRQLIKENNIRVMATIATYAMPYAFAGTILPYCGYFDKDVEMGPVVGQGTHIVDLSRYIAGEAIVDTLHVNTVELEDGPGKLGQLQFDEEVIPKEKRIPHLTSAMWRWESGAMGSLVHSCTLHNGEYHCELTIVADGWMIRLQNPYGDSSLFIRRPGETGAEEVIKFPGDDPFYGEMSAIVDAVDKQDKSLIQSPYSDAAKTYELTWAIRLAGEKHTASRQPVGHR